MSSMSLVFRVSYRRANWKPGTWKHKLFNTDVSAEKYAANLVKPVDDDTPEQFRNLAAAQVYVSAGPVRWQPVEIGVPNPMNADNAKREEYRASYAKHHDGEVPTDAVLDAWIELVEAQ